MIHNAYAFFDGMQINGFFDNFTNCFSGITNISFVERHNARNYLGNPVNTPFNKTLVTLKYIQHWSVMLMDCNSVAINVVNYFTHQMHI
mmetsp:Transcript_32832/g.32058  ORF Transcript_32832/g.32058 Transcript_32832/m.32058 type:complete len:89 (+) Transcript_32832:145-411(+)